MKPSFVEHGSLFLALKLIVVVVEFKMGAKVAMAFATCDEELSAHLHSAARYILKTEARDMVNHVSLLFEV